MRAAYEVREETNLAATPVFLGLSEPVTAPGVASVQMPAGLLSDESTYRWRARLVAQPGKHSDWSEWQRLTVDRVAPDLPVVSSAQYPEGEWGPVLGTPATFDFSSTSADVAVFVWSVNSANPTTTAAEGTGFRTASVSFTPSVDGVNVLTVYALDEAGWRSEERTYQFWVTPLPERYAHWALDESDGTLAADAGTVSAPATLSGEVSFGPGCVGGSNGAWFTGAGGQIATAGPVLDTTRSYTVMAWVNPADLSLGQQSVLSQDGPDSGGFALRYEPAANAGLGGWCFAAQLAEPTNSTATVCADGSVAGAPTAGQWVHLAATYDAVTQQIAVYVMGGENCVGETGRSAVSGMAPAGGPFVIGRAAAGQAWRGGVDDVYAHQRVLSEVEICQQALQ